MNLGDTERVPSVPDCVGIVTAFAEQRLSQYTAL